MRQWKQLYYLYRYVVSKRDCKLGQQCLSQFICRYVGKVEQYVCDLFLFSHEVVAVIEALVAAVALKKPNPEVKVKLALEMLKLL